VADAFCDQSAGLISVQAEATECAAQPTADENLKFLQALDREQAEALTRAELLTDLDDEARRTAWQPLSTAACRAISR
jgi:hypothetical protein